MKNKLLIFLIIFFFKSTLLAEDIFIESKIINLDKKKELSIFKDDVVVTTSDNSIIKSDYAEYNKKKGIITLKNNVEATDTKNNRLISNFAIYDQNRKTLKSIGVTKITTPENYTVEGID